MESLADMDCKSEDRTKLDQNEVNRYFEMLGDKWELTNGKLNTKFTFRNFMEAIAFVNVMAAIAESINHHPNISIEYKHVSVSIFTHSFNGLSKCDFILAFKIEAARKLIL